MDQFVERIRTIYPLNSLGPQQFDALLAGSSPAYLRKGQTVFTHGTSDSKAYYLLEGELRAEFPDGNQRRIDVNADAANYAIGNLQPRPYTALVSSEKATLLQLDRAAVERMVARSQMVTGEMPAVSVVNVSEGNQADGGWMFQVIQSEVFRELPTENIARFFAAIERLDVAEDELIVRQGEAGDYYYMIAQGEAAVMRKVGRMEMPLSQLGPGDSFGEEALISGLPRNASVKMTRAGVLMRLSKDEFTELIKQPTIQSIKASAAARQVAQDKAQLIDVRLENEHGKGAIRGSANIPLYRLRDRIEALDPEQHYIFYCDSGGRSSAAAFLLSERGYNACFLEGGLSALISERSD